MSDYEKIKSLIKEADMLIEKQVDSDSPEFQAWEMKVERYLIQRYGEKSIEVKKYRGVSFSVDVYLPSTPDTAFIEACCKGIRTVKLFLGDLLEETKGKEDSKLCDALNKTTCFDRVFIVHGHNEMLKVSVARLLEKQNIKAIILNEQVNQGKTIIEKFEKYSDVSSAICLFTSDDLGKEQKESSYKKRARQNVVFETGFFIGRLGRDKVIILADRDVEMPSDMQGIVYSDTNLWEIEVLKELHSIGYNIDLNKIL